MRKKEGGGGEKEKRRGSRSCLSLICEGEGFACGTMIYSCN